MRKGDGRMLILSNTTFYTTKGNPTNLQLCPRGEWQDCILVETVLSRLMVAIYCKLVQHRVWMYFHARLAFIMAALHMRVLWHGL